MAYEPTQAKRIADGLCKECGAPRGEQGTKIRCRPCADIASARASANKEARRAAWADDPMACKGCGAPRDRADRTRCAKCRERAQRYYSESGKEKRRGRALQGICRTCKEPRFHESRACSYHWALDLCKHYGVDRDRETIGRILAMLAAQEFRCYYTGTPLVPGVNASLDHRVPRSKGGSLSDLDNLVWCDRNINAFKNDLSEAEFVERCRAVVARFG